MSSRNNFHEGTIIPGSGCAIIVRNPGVWFSNDVRWREFNPENTIRCWALRLRERGLIKSIPSTRSLPRPRTGASSTNSNAS